MKKILHYFRHEVVLTVALIAALASFLLVPPGAHTLAGIDTTTLLMLFSLMTIVAGFRHMGAFDKLAGAVTSRIHTLRGLSMALTAANFLLAMVATNDVALITLVPFTLLLMRGDKVPHITLTVVLDTIAANLGSMVTPIGNPQNLYLYASGKLDAMAFPALTWPYAALAFALLMLCCLLIPADKIAPSVAAEGKLPAKKLGLYAVLTVIVIAAIAALEPKLLRELDIALLLTFVCFFIVSGNLGRIEAVRAFLQTLLDKNALLTAVAASQVISNVPAAVLLSEFTEQWQPLLEGVNIGGLGTPIASLASLITLKLYLRDKSAKAGRFLAVFTLSNIAGLVILLAAAMI